MRSVLMPGLRIGEGAIVASGAIVTKDVEPYPVAGGNPVQFLKYRFSKDTVDTIIIIKNVWLG